ncbi:type IV secretion system DNA-binding domain-containing protein [Patescibacteria group bacterium]|nr:type IV secretion system DNA-binding domain-containing protein [Patescibacteria group bacterium]
MPEEYLHDHENEITLFAETNFRDARRRFGIKTDDRRRHMYIMGKTGMGKTTLLENMVLSDILAGHGVCYIDPHGDTAEKILDFIPPNRINDVVYFNPADMDFPVGFNILESVADDKKHLVANGLMGVFKKIWPDVWSPRMEYILGNCVLALLDYPGATLLGINRLLVDKEYRTRVVEKIRDPLVKTFWVAEFTSWSEKYATEAIAPVQNKVGQFLSSSVIRNIVAQVKSTVDPRRIMDEGKILIVNLSKGKIGEDNMRLLGGMLVTKIQMSAMERVDIKYEKDRRDFYLYVDEFQNFANQSFANILSEARKYRLNLIVAHQYIKQLEEEVAWAVFGNVGTLITFRVGAEDAAFLENEFMPTFTPEDLVNLAKYQVYLKLMVDGASTQPFSANTLSPIGKRTGSEAKVIAVSRERYASPRSDIEQKVLRWSGMEAGEAAMPLTVKYPDILTDDERSASAQATADAEESGSQLGGGEYLKISAERMATFTKPQQQGVKKDKPKFPHTCTRCGKVWDMPIQLDASRPIYCAECLPIVKEEKQIKQKVVKTGFRQPEVVGSFAPSEESASDELSKTFASFEDRPVAPKPVQNRPRVVGEVRPLPPRPSGTIKIVRGDDAPEDGLLAEILKSKGGAIETRKDRLTENTAKATESVGSQMPQGDGFERKKRKRKKKNRHPESSSEAPVEAWAPMELERPPEPVATKPTVTVFKPMASSVRSGLGNGPRESAAPIPSNAFETPAPTAEEMNPLDKRLSHQQVPGASGQIPSAGQPLQPGKRITF